MLAEYAELPCFETATEIDEQLCLSSRSEVSSADFTVGFHLYHAEANMDMLHHPEVDDTGAWYVDFLLPDNSVKLFADTSVPPGSCARLRCYLTDKKVVIDRDTDLLTPEEYQKNF